jgi:hypothetical protein
MRAAGLLLLLVLPARGQEWITRWADDAFSDIVIKIRSS